MIGKILARLHRRVNKKSIFMNQNPDYNKYQIGEWTYGYPKILTGETENGTLVMGKFCSIGPNVQFVLNTTQYRPTFATTVFPALHDSDSTKVCPPSCGDIVIGNDVWVGNNAVVMPGVTLGDGCVVGARTFVVKDVPPYAIVIGNPNRVIKYRWKSEHIERLMRIRWWDWPISKIEEAFPYILSHDIEAFLDHFGDI